MSYLVVKLSVRVFKQVPVSGRHTRMLAFYLFICLSLNLILSNLNLLAQYNTLYLMPDIPQVNQLNPALFKLCRIYIELPVISSVKVNIRNTGFGFHEVIQSGTGTQSDPYRVNLSRLESKLNRINYSQIETDINLLGFG